MELVLDLIKYHRYLFEEGIDVSEWDFIRKFWAPVLENLPALSGSRLEWGDTTLFSNNFKKQHKRGFEDFK